MTSTDHAASPARDANADDGATQDNSTTPALAGDAVVQVQLDLKAVAAEPAQQAGNEVVPATEAEQSGAEAAATSLVSTSLAAVPVAPSGPTSSAHPVAVSASEGAAGVAAGADAVLTQAARTDAGAASAVMDAGAAAPEGKTAAAEAPPRAAAGGVAKADEKASEAALARSRADLLSQAEGSGSGGKPADVAKDVAKDAAKTELMAQLEQGAGAPPQLQAKPVDLSSAKPDVPAPLEAPLPQGAKPIPPSAVPVEIGLRTLQGLREFQIRLDPAELGRVDVRLEINDDKTVSARVVVDRVETLHLLQRDAKTLERAFEQAGLKSSDSGIDITLRDPGQQAHQRRGEEWAGEGQVSGRRNASAVSVEPVLIPIRRTLHVGALDRSI